jgi:hypothetical protein
MKPPKLADLPGCCPHCGTPLAQQEAEKFSPQNREVYVLVVVLVCGGCEYVREVSR